jgi:hypothetical protein
MPDGAKKASSSGNDDQVETLSTFFVLVVDEEAKEARVCHSKAFTS